MALRNKYPSPWFLALFERCHHTCLSKLYFHHHLTNVSFFIAIVSKTHYGNKKWFYRLIQHKWGKGVLCGCSSLIQIVIKSLLKRKLSRCVLSSLLPLMTFSPEGSSNTSNTTWPNCNRHTIMDAPNKFSLF